MVENHYFNQEILTVNGLTAESLPALSNSVFSLKELTPAPPIGASIELEFFFYRRKSDGSEDLCEATIPFFGTVYTALVEKIVDVYFIDLDLSPTDSIVCYIFVSVNGGAFVSWCAFTTPCLGALHLNSSTSVLHLWISYTQQVFRIFYGFYPSRIADVSYNLLEPTWSGELQKKDSWKGELKLKGS